MPKKASMARLRQWRSTSGQSRFSFGQTKGRRMQNASTQRQKLKATGGTSACTARPMKMLPPQQAEAMTRNKAATRGDPSPLCGDIPCREDVIRMPEAVA